MGEFRTGMLAGVLLGGLAGVVGCNDSVTPPGTDGGGGGTSGGSCGQTVAPCGGSLIGTWKASARCGAPSFYAFPSCPDPIVDLSPFVGSLTFDGGGTYTSTLAISGTDVITYPAACLTAGAAPPITCASIEAQIKSFFGNYPALFSSESCTGDADCVCSLVIVPQSAPSGTYQVTGTRASLSAPMIGDFDYCVENNTFHWLGSRRGDDNVFVRK